MERNIAIRIISKKFSIPEKDIFELLEKKGSSPKQKNITPKKEVKYSSKTVIVDKKDEGAQRKKYFFTEDDFALLNKQIESVSEEIRRIGAEIGDSTSDSKTFHDNFEYEELGRQQKMWTNRFNSLEKFKRNVEIVRLRDSYDSVSIGCTVKIKMDSGEVLEKRIGSYVTFSDSDLSYNSPLAKIMIGKKAGEKVRGEIENQYYSFTIKEVS